MAASCAAPRSCLASGARRPADLPRGTVTLLFCDVEGSTELTRRLAERWPDLRRRQRELLRAAVEEAGGAVVDCQGDELFAAFGSARAGVAAAAAAQRALAAEAWPDGIAVRTRMGLHSGEPQLGPDGYAGIDVVRAARLCTAAHGGQVLVSETTRLLSGARTVDLGRVALRDVGEPEPVHQLEVDGAPGAFPPLRAAGAESGGESAAQRRIDEAGRRLEAEIDDDVSRAIADAFRRRR